MDEYPYPITGGGFRFDIPKDPENPNGIWGYATGIPMPVELRPVEADPDTEALDVDIQPLAADNGTPAGTHPSGDFAE